MNPASNVKIPFNPIMFRWAREWRGISIEEAAKKVNKKPEDILAWENNEKKPTVKQARNLSDLYGRSFLEFFLPEPPVVYIPKAVPDFRMHRGIIGPEENRIALDIHRWAEAHRISALDLFTETDELLPELPKQIFSNIKTPPDTAANNARAALNFSFEEQTKLQKDELNKLPDILRRKFEAAGILTLRRSDLKNAKMRGMCIAEFPLPVIVFSKESPAAQAYTLAHEFAHVIIKESGITGQEKIEYVSQPIEKWCDQFAAAFLMPQIEVENIWGKKPNVSQALISESDLQNLAEKFRVSQHAMLIRLVHLGYIKSSYYWDVKKPLFDNEESNFKSFGRAAYYGVRYKSSLGELYTGLVLEAWQSGKITNHNAAEFMGIKNITHLNDIRNNFGKSE